MRKLAKIIIAALVIALVIIAIIQGIRVLQTRTVVLASATGPWDSGLLSNVTSAFERKYGVTVDVRHVGTGQAIQMAKNGEADLVLANSKDMEMDFVNSGYGVHRVGIMYNNFVIVGPPDDPAGISGLNATEAFKRIKSAGDAGKATFVSRGDNSGTNAAELKIWNLIGFVPNTGYGWYLESKKGMGDTLRMCNNNAAYTLTDKGTWLSLSDQLSSGLKLLVIQGGKGGIFLNPYSIILVNSTKYPNRNYQDALGLARFFISEEGQELIRDFKKQNESLFIPFARDFATAISLGYPSQQTELEWYIYGSQQQ